MSSPLALALVVLLGSASAVARPNLDSLATRVERRSLAVSEETLAARGLSVSSMETRFGVPAFVWADVQRLRSGQAPTLSNLSPEQAARTYLQQNADLYRLSPEEVANASVIGVHRTDRGPVIVSFGQAVQGVEVFRHELKVTMTQERALVAISGYLPPAGKSAVRSLPVFRTGANAAVATALQDLSGLTTTAGAVTPAPMAGGYTEWRLDAKVQGYGYQLSGPVRSKKVLFAAPDHWAPAYYVEAQLQRAFETESEVASYVISAEDGSLLFRNDLRANDAYTYRVWGESWSFFPYDSPFGADVSPHPTGVLDGYLAPLIPANDITLQNFPNSKNDAWLPPNATQTRGNNVDAYADTTSPDGFTPGADLRATTSAPGVFGDTYDHNTAPGTSAQRRASVAQLFYTTNFLHDWFYDAGFNEQAGNPQSLNFGRGGLEGDMLLAESQDYASRNRSSATVPADGVSPKIQMSLYNPRPTVTVQAPAGLSGSKIAGQAAFGPPTFTVTGDVKLASADPVLACSALPAGSLSGKVAYVDRGTCTYAIKVKNAQTAGAIAVVIANNVDTTSAADMSGVDSTIAIPAVMIPLSQGSAWKTALNGGGTITVKLENSDVFTRDAALDTTLVAHEWGHVLTGRLVGNGNGLTNSQGRALAEGWSDFLALLSIVREEDRNRPGNDQFQGIYAVGTYANSTRSPQAAYFGERRVPYSTSFAKNALTFKHLGAGAALPTTHPVDTPLSTAYNTVPQASGEVWATALWECYASLLNAYPFQEARNRMKQYLVAALKVTPTAPTFNEARDALLVTVATYDDADSMRFVAAFAKRGLGFGATSPDRWSADHLGVKESFVTGNALEVVSVTLDDSEAGCDRDGVLDVGETGLLQVTVRNVGGSALSSFTGTVTASGATAAMQFPNGNTLFFPALQQGGAVTRSIPVKLNAVTGATPSAGLTITFDEPSLPTAQRSVSFSPRVHSDITYRSSAFEEFDAGLSAWTISGDWKPREESGAKFLRSASTGAASEAVLTSPWLTVNPTGTLTMSIRHRYSFLSNYNQAPYWNGGVIEVTDDGVRWYRLLEDLDVDPGYTAFLEPGHALAGFAAWAGTSANYPSFNTTNVSLSTLLAGKTVRFRFRTAAAGPDSSLGWDIDRIAFTNLANTPFPAVGAEPSDGMTCNRAPVAVASGPRQVQENTAGVALNGTSSFDADGQTLTYQWTQLSGPAVTLSNAASATPSFTAPEVSSDSVLAFQLVVSDGTDSSAPAVATVNVLNVNRAPVAVVAPVGAVAERSMPTITLNGSGSTDGDGDTLTYAWSQTSGPSVTLSGANSAQASFAMPEVTADTTYAFKLTVSDGKASSTATVSVTILNVNRPPELSTPTTVLAKARDSVTLTATGTDPDGDPITYSWTQVGGDPVVLSGANSASATFTAPNVQTLSTLSFRVTVSDGNATTSEDVTVTVNAANRAPVVVVTPSFESPERTQITLSAVGTTDADGDLLTYSWAQLGGPVLALTDTFSQTLTVELPDVAIDTLFVFAVTVDDGYETVTLETSVLVHSVDQAPTLTASPSITAPARGTVTLEASATDPDGDAITYAWTQIPGDTVELSDATSARPTFAAPDTLVDLTYEFQVTATANGQTTTPVKVTVQIHPVNRAPVAQVTPSFTSPERTTIELSATGSTDPDGDTLSYTWKQIGGPVLALAATTQSTLSVALPDVVSDTLFVFEVTVSDSLLSATGVVSVTVTSVDRAPLVTVTPVVQAKARSVVTLEATATDPEGDTITFQWTQKEGDAVVLDDATRRTPSFTAPDTNELKTLKFEVVASANGLDSAPAVVEVQVSAENRPPVAKAPEAFGVQERSTVTLSDDGSSDPDNDALTFRWTQLGGPTVTLTDGDTDEATFSAPDVSEETLLTFQLVVNDGQLDSAPSTVVVTVRLDNRIPTASARVVSGGVAGQTVVLDGTESSDLDGDKLTYSWTQTSGGAVQLTGANAGVATFTAPAVAAQTTLGFELMVTDPSGETAKASVQVVIEPAPAAVKDSGCGCSSASGMELGLLSLAMLVIRRRRQR
jgi:MYXO-CTERM domain-containing protein